MEPWSENWPVLPPDAGTDIPTTFWSRVCSGAQTQRKSTRTIASKHRSVQRRASLRILCCMNMFARISDDYFPFQFEYMRPRSTSFPAIAVFHNLHMICDTSPVQTTRPKPSHEPRNCSHTHPPTSSVCSSIVRPRSD